MFYIIVMLCIFILTNGFVLIEEELLIILAGFLWVDAAGKLISNFLLNELYYKTHLLKNKYVWFLKRKLKLDDLVIRGYYKRIYRFLRAHREVAEHVVPKLVVKNVEYIVKNSILLNKYDIHLYLNSLGNALIKDYVLYEIEQLVLILVENKLYINNYSSPKYFSTTIGVINTNIVLTI